MLARVLTAAALALISVVIASEVELSPDDFDTVVDGSKDVFIKFYAPCKRDG